MDTFMDDRNSSHSHFNENYSKEIAFLGTLFFFFCHTKKVRFALRDSAVILAIAHFGALKGR